MLTTIAPIAIALADAEDVRDFAVEMDAEVL